MMVLFNDTPDNETIRPGMEITKVNGHSAAAILRRILPLVPGDGDIETGKWNEISNIFAQYYWLAFEQSTEFTVEARNGSGLKVVAHLAGVTDSERRTNQNVANAAIRAKLKEQRGWSSDNLSMRFLCGGEVAEIHIGHFVGDNFSQWVETTFETLQQKQTGVLILDLRGNGGGEDKNVALFLSFLVNKPFRYLDHVDVKTITPSFQDQLGWSADFSTILKERTVPNPSGGYLLTAEMLPGLADQPPADHTFQGKIFVFIDGGSFSGAADLAALIHHLKRGTFIGEETGGGYYGNSSGKLPTVTLPNSGLKLQLPLYGYWNAVAGDDGERRGTRPDYVVPTNLSAVLQGQDEQLNTALKLAGCSPVR
jgi:C-terminal processing protease CtpA/Prc